VRKGLGFVLSSLLHGQCHIEDYTHLGGLIKGARVVRLDRRLETHPASFTTGVMSVVCGLLKSSFL
jgi:hypothetical protein